jgi:hypothetical protein
VASVADEFPNIRDAEFLGALVGRRLVDITQQDADEFAERGTFVCFHFDNGRTVTFPINDAGFDVETVD